MKKIVLLFFVISAIISCRSSKEALSFGSDSIPLSGTKWGVKNNLYGGYYSIQEVEFYDDKNAGITLEGTGVPRRTDKCTYKQDGLRFKVSQNDSNSKIEGVVKSKDVITLIYKVEKNKTDVDLYRLDKRP